jgi:uncharacterized protein (DUF1810 family)
MADALTAREEELRVAGDRLQGILDHATTLISIKDVDGRYILVGRTWQEAAGRSAEEVLGSIDAVKLRSSMTLFHRATPDEPIFAEILDRFFDGRTDAATDALLGPTTS